MTKHVFVPKQKEFVGHDMGSDVYLELDGVRVVKLPREVADQLFEAKRQVEWPAATLAPMPVPRPPLTWRKPTPEAAAESADARAMRERAPAKGEGPLASALRDGGLVSVSETRRSGLDKKYEVLLAAIFLDGGKSILEYVEQVFPDWEHKNSSYMMAKVMRENGWIERVGKTRPARYRVTMAGAAEVKRLEKAGRL